MHIALIGSGNTATVFGRILKGAGHVITGVYSKTLTHAQRLGVELNAQHCGSIENIAQDAQVYIIAVTDDNITTVAGSLHVPGKTVVHTSGSVSKDVLKYASGRYGVLYPLQSLRREPANQPQIPLLVDGSDDEVMEQVKALALSISPLVEEADDDKRLKLHLAAVMASNFANHLYALTEEFCRDEQVPFKMLAPLIEEVAQRAASYSPAAMQTGPAVRNDLLTIEKHRELLNAYPLQKKLYDAITASITAFYSKKA